MVDYESKKNSSDAPVIMFEAADTKICECIFPLSKFISTKRKIRTREFQNINISLKDIRTKPIRYVESK